MLSSIVTAEIGQYALRGYIQDVDVDQRNDGYILEIGKRDKGSVLTEDMQNSDYQLARIKKILSERIQLRQHFLVSLKGER